MIYSISLNSCLDHNFRVISIRDDDINRISDARTDAGGKGLNVARMLAGLGEECVALTLLGGEEGAMIKELLLRESVQFRYVDIKGATRDVYNFTDGLRTMRFNTEGASISADEWSAFNRLFEEMNPEKGDVVSMSGSLPPGLPRDAYKQIIENTGAKGCYTVLDTDGEVFIEGLKAGPCLIKPNLWELGRLAGDRIDSFDKLSSAAGQIIQSGVKTVLVTLGSRGAAMFTHETALYASVPEVRVESSVGCGDAFLGGFLFAQERGMGDDERLRFAAAAGTAKVMRKGTLMPDLDLVSRVSQNVKVCLAEKCSLDSILAERME